MAKRTAEEVEATVRRCVADWASFLGVDQQWFIQMHFLKASKMEDAEDKASASWPNSYTTAILKFNLDQWRKDDSPCDCDIEETVVHELLHLVDAPVWDKIGQNFTGDLKRDICNVLERHTDITARIIMRSRYGAYRCSRCIGAKDANTIQDDDSTDDDGDGESLGGGVSGRGGLLQGVSFEPWTESILADSSQQYRA